MKIPFSDRLTIRRPKPAVLDHGMVKQTSEFQEISVRGTILPVNKETVTLTAGKSLRDAISIFTDIKVDLGDLVINKGHKYEIFQVLEFPKHYESQATKVE